MGLSIQKLGQATKFLFNRMRGVKYGGVRFQDGPVQLVKTSKLRKLNNSFDDLLGSDYITRLSSDQLNTIIRRTKPLQNGSKISTKGDCISFINAHGASQVYDNAANKPVMDICERLSSPIKTWWNG